VPTALAALPPSESLDGLELLLPQAAKTDRSDAGISPARIFMVSTRYASCPAPVQYRRDL
jgi:hypothetical protein